MPFEPRNFGRTDLTVSPLGLAPGAGTLPARELARAYERGIRTYYWGTSRAAKFGEGLRELARERRDDITIVIQTYTRVGALMRPSLESALRKLRIDHTDLLLLGWWNEPPPERIVEAALALRERGLARHLLISCHNRMTFRHYAEDERYGGIMVRYNAVHPGAETEVFPVLGDSKPGVACYTATRWGHLLDPSALPSDEPAPRASDCYRFVLTNPAVDVCMCAPRSAEDLDEALTTIERGPMSDEELAWMKRVGVHVKKVTVGRRTYHPVEMLDRLANWLTPKAKAGLDSARD